MWFIGRRNWDTCDELRAPDILCNPDMTVRSTSNSDFPRRNSVYFPAIHLNYSVCVGSSCGVTFTVTTRPAATSSYMLDHVSKFPCVLTVRHWFVHCRSLLITRHEVELNTIYQSFLQFFPPKLYIYVSFHFRRAIYPSHRRDTKVFTNPVYIYIYIYIQ